MHGIENEKRKESGKSRQPGHSSSSEMPVIPTFTVVAQLSMK
jgi:hypothetical protein